jgi:hypothetical protein
MIHPSRTKQIRWECFKFERVQFMRQRDGGGFRQRFHNRLNLLSTEQRKSKKGLRR